MNRDSSSLQQFLPGYHTLEALALPCFLQFVPSVMLIVWFMRNTDKVLIPLDLTSI